MRKIGSGWARTGRAVVVSLLVLLGATAHAGAQGERIVSFTSDIGVRADGSLRVTETITVIAEGSGIKRGIYRDFPTMYRGKWGLRKSVPFEVLGVTRNGADEPYVVEGLSNGVRVRIGRERAMLPHGEHTYAITYETANQLGFFATHDELYWNVTGPGWDFPIDRIAARVTLPGGVDADAVRLEAYTGTEGSTDRDYTARIADDGAAVFETTGPQPVGGNMTIVVGWPTGVIDQAAAKKAGAVALLRSNLFLVISGAGVIIAWVYLHAAWFRIGRDPARGVIAPRLEPPEGMSPGACRYLLKTGHDHTCYAAALFHLAVSGVVSIGEGGDGAYTIRRLDREAEPVFADERAIARVVVPEAGAFVYESKNHAPVGRSIEKQKESLKADYGDLFAKNRMGLVWGVAILFIGWVASVLTLPVESMMVAGFMSVWLGFWSIGCAALVIGAVGMWAAVIKGENKSAYVGAPLLTLFALPFLGAWGFGVYQLALVTSLWLPVIVVPAFVLIVVYARLLPAPTVEGRRLMDEIEGFALYLDGGGDRGGAGGDAGRFDQQTFERWLPYAVALDKSRAWAAYFESFVDSELEAEGRRDLEVWHPVWLHGIHDGFSPSAFCDSFGSSLAGAVSSSSSSPGSSSGFSGGGSGGGSSGGGGGGGGGGGW